MPIPKHDMLVNVPVTITIKYVDVWPGEKFGPQVSVKGTIDGETKVIYINGKAWANLKALKEGGVIGEYDKSAEEPTEKVAMTVLATKPVTLCREQKKGEKFATLTVRQDGATSHATASTPVAEGSAPPKKEKESGAAMYAKITDYVLSSIVPKYTSAGIPVTMEGTAAIVATMFIQHNKQ